MAAAATKATINSMRDDCTALAPRPRARQTPARAASTIMNATNGRIAMLSFVARDVA